MVDLSDLKGKLNNSMTFPGTDFRDMETWISHIRYGHQSNLACVTVGVYSIYIYTSFARLHMFAKRHIEPHGIPPWRPQKPEGTSKYDGCSSN